MLQQTTFLYKMLYSHKRCVICYVTCVTTTGSTCYLSCCVGTDRMFISWFPYMDCVRAALPFFLFYWEQINTCYSCPAANHRWNTMHEHFAHCWARAFWCKHARRLFSYEVTLRFRYCCRSSTQPVLAPAAHLFYHLYSICNIAFNTASKHMQYGICLDAILHMLYNQGYIT